MKKTLPLIIFLMSGICSFATLISKDSCIKVAANYYYSKTGVTPAVKSVVNIYKYTTVKNGNRSVIDSTKKYLYGYAVNFLSGWVLIQRQNTINAIQGWNARGDFKVPSPSSKVSIIGYLQVRGEDSKAAANLKQSHTNQWQYLSSRPRVNASTSAVILPTCPYGQDGAGVNDSCPLNTSDNMRCETGCGCTAMVIIMSYWNWPTKGIGSYSYNDTPPYYSYNYGVQSANFGTFTIDWSTMPKGMIGNPKFADFNHKVGVSVGMDYGDLYQGGSGSYVAGAKPSCQDAYVNNWQYANTITNITASSTWINQISAEIKAGRLVQWYGYDVNGQGGHTAVIAGYDPSNQFVYMQWGWNNQDNGWFNIAALNVAGYSFNSGDGALIGIYPGAGYVPPTPNSCQISAFSFTGITTNSFTANWTALNDSFSIIRYQLANTSTWTTIPQRVTGTQAIIASLVATSTYNIRRVNYCRGGGIDSLTGSVTTASAPCLAPTNLTAMGITSTGAVLNWTGGQSNNNWAVWTGTTASGSENAVVVTNPWDSLTNLIPSTEYGAHITGQCANGGLANSYEIYFTTLGNTTPTCGTPTGLVSVKTDTTHATITFGTVSGAKGYAIQYWTGTAAKKTLMVAANTIALGGLSPNTTYNWQVMAICTNGVSGSYSPSITFTTQPLPTPPPTCPAPIDLTTKSTVTQTLAWSGSATNYTVNYKLASATTYTTINNVIGNSVTIPVLTDSAYLFNVIGNCSGVNSAVVSGTFVGGK